MGGRKLVSYFEFDTASQPELVIKVALSASSTEGALKNLQAEAASQGFEQLAVKASDSGNTS